MNTMNLWWFGPQHNFHNYGDELSKFIAEKISNNTVKYVHYNTKAPFYLSIGSVLGHGTTSKYSTVWGTGLMNYNEGCNKNATYCAVRGPLTRKRLLELNIDCPDVLGDPALLMKKLYDPVIEKKYEIGIIPHYVDYEYVVNAIKDPRIKIIKFATADVINTTNQILECKRIISSSLHGVIVPHSYNIPTLYTKFSNKVAGKGFKFKDYFLSVGIEPYMFDFETKVLEYDDLIKFVDSNANINTIQTFDFDKLLNSCPFK